MKPGKLVVVTIVGIMMVLAVPKITRAISIVPPTLDFATAQPGQTLTGQVKILNNDKEFKTYYLSTATFTSGGETGEPKFDFAAPITDLAAWIKTDTNQVDLQPDGKAVINLTIAIPKDAQPGGHYAGVFFSSTPPDAGNVKIRQQTGTLVILSVAGQVHESAQVASFSVKGGSLLTRLPASFDLRVQNTGNVHIRPQGSILIKNLFGGETETLSLNDANGAVLPNSVRSFEATWKKSAASQDKKGFFGELNQQWTNFALGPYTATATMTFGSNGQSLLANTKVTIFPWQVMFVELLIIVAVVLIIVFGLRQYNKAIIRRAQQTRPPKAQK